MHSSTSQSTSKARLSKILSVHGVASRRSAEVMISKGRVRVNGVVANLGQSAMPGVDKIEIDGKPLKTHEQRVYIMLNKPKGYLTTVSDDKGRKTVMELVTVVGADGRPVRLFPVGRLDLDSEGLLLLTNDGEFANAAAHPRYGKAKTYEVHVEGDAKKAAKLLAKPIVVDGYTASATEARLVSVSDGGGILRISIEEGRNRQIRKMCIACGLRVKLLRRVSIGGLRLGTLEVGKWRHLTEDEVEQFAIKN